jgi:hypothetical protein
MNNRSAKEPAQPTSTPRNPSSTGHISEGIRADLGKLHPEQRAEILRVADAK